MADFKLLLATQRKNERVDPFKVGDRVKVKGYECESGASLVGTRRNVACLPSLSAQFFKSLGHL
jgi:hypothetical protein